MSTLQKSFTYEGDLKKAPLKNISLNFRIPVYAYIENTIPGNQPIIRSNIDTASVAIDKALNSKDYTVKLPVDAIIGKDDASVINFQKYLMYSIESRKLDNLSTTVEVEYVVDTTNKIGSRSFEAVYFFTLIPQANQLLKMVSRFEFDRENPILINKAAYLSLLSTLRKFSPSQDDFYLLEIILRLIDHNAEFPFISKKIPDEVRNSVFQILKSDNPEPLEIIKNGFKELFDFPIAIPEIKTLEAAGKFTVLTGDNSKITKKELAFYDLVFEYTINDGKNTYSAVHIDPSKAAGSIVNNSINFSFTNARQIILNNINDPVSVKVKGFDGSVLWARQFSPDAPELKELKIEVPLMRPVQLTTLGKDDPVDLNKKLRGQVIVYNKDCSLKDIVVNIQAKKDGAETFSIVGSAKTDASGNFFMPYPFGRYTAAQAITSLTPNDPVDIATSGNKENNQTISDDFLFLLVTNADCPPKKEEEDCECDSPKKASRLPDQDDLIRSDEYSQDLGGSCINLSTPNRTLREYTYQAIVRTSDPDVSNYTLRKINNNPALPEYATLVNIKGSAGIVSGHKAKNPIDSRFELVAEAGKISRRPVDLDNPIKWQDAPDEHENLKIYQAVTIATGHILHYKSKFKADGYSLGDLLYSLALAPGQKKEIVVFDATHTLLGSETQQITQRENIAANLINERDITDQLGGNLNESLRGQSSSNTSGVSAGGGLGFSYGGFGVSLGVSGGSSSSEGSSSQNSARDISQFFGEKLRQSITQNADSYRQLNASVVTTVKENQKYSATTEVVANHNHCHALTILYFEVLRHFAVYQELSSVEECVFVPFLMTNFSVENIYKWRDVLAMHLLPMPSNTYLSSLGFGGNFQHPLLKGFDANERIRTNYANVDFPAGAYDDEAITNIKGTITVRVDLSKPKSKYDRIKTFPVTSVPNFPDFQLWVWNSFFGPLPFSMIDQYITVDPNFLTVPPRDCIRVIKFDDNFFNKGKDIIDETLWRSYAILLNYGSDVFGMLDNYFSGKLISEWEEIYNNEIAPVVFERIMETVHFEPMSKGGISARFSPAIKYNGGEKQIGIHVNAGSTSLKRNQFDLNLVIAASSDGHIANLKDLVTFDVREVQLNYSTPHYNGVLYAGYSGVSLFGGVSLFIPENSDEKRDPKKEDIFIVNKLIEHLNSNLEYYNKILWYRLDPDRRYMLLDGFNIDVFNDLGAPLPPRSLGSVVKNQLITVAGNSLVFPVAAGYKVNTSYVLEESPEGNKARVSLFDHYKPLTPVDPYRISVPTRGVFAETLQSYCNACEKIEVDRVQDWTKFPNTDEPTPFAPVAVPTPTVTDWKAVFKELGPPVVNIQNAPALPAPGAGLTGLSELLGKAGIFKDITGLDATQQAALRTYLSNQDNAKAFAEMAKELAMQDHNTQHSDKIGDSLKQAKDSGAINQEDYSRLTKEHLQKQIDGGSTADRNATNNETSLSKAAVDSASVGKNVKATKTDTKTGLVETLEVEGSSNLTDSGSDSKVGLKLLIPDPANPTQLIPFNPNVDSIGFGAFDNAFDPLQPNDPLRKYDVSTNPLKPDFIDNDSHRFYIEIYESKVDPGTQTIEIDWYTTFDKAGNSLYDLTPNTKLTLTRDSTKKDFFRSKALLLVHEEIDLDIVVDGKKKGDKDFRMRLAGMFSFVKIQYTLRADTNQIYPIFQPASLRQLPVNIFTLRNSANNPVATTDSVGSLIAKLQDIYDNVGILVNASSEYSFSSPVLAQKIPTPSVSKRNIEYKVNEITVPNTINTSAITKADTISIAGMVLPAPSKVRIFIIDKCDPSFKSSDVLAFSHSKSAAKNNRSLVNTLFITTRALTGDFPTVIAHELGHLLMDKRDFLSSENLPLPTSEKQQSHYNSNDLKMPNAQNLMNSSTEGAVSVFSSKRIWNVKDADGYNQFDDLKTNRMGLLS